MCIFAPDPCLFDLNTVMTRLPASDQTRVMSEELRAACMATFAHFVEAEGSICDEDLSRAVMAAVPAERHQVLGITAETARSLLSKLGLKDVTEQEYLHLWQWAEAEKTLELFKGPIVALVLPDGFSRFGVDAVEQAISRLDTLVHMAHMVMTAGDLIMVQKMWEKCVPSFNPAGFRSCQTAALKALVPLVKLAKKMKDKRAPLLEAVARITAGNADNARYAGRMQDLQDVLGQALRAGASALDSQMGLMVASSIAPFDGTALVDLVPEIVAHATTELPGTFACVQSSALSVLSQLSAHENLQAFIAALLTMPALLRMFRQHRALENPHDRFDFQLLCLNLLPFRTADYELLDSLLEDLVLQGSLNGLVEALAASVIGAEWPIGSNCFRRPVPLINVLCRVCRAGKAALCREAYRSLAALLDDEPRAALAGLRELATSRLNAEVMGADEALMAQVQEIIDESKAFDDGVLAEEGEALQRELAAQACGVYDVADFEELCGGKRVVQLRGTDVESGYTLHCSEYDRALDLLIDAEVIVWDHVCPPEHGPTGRPEDSANFSTSYTQMLVRVLTEANRRASIARAHGENPASLLVAGFLNSGVQQWTELAEAFPGQVVFFAKPIRRLEDSAVPPPVPLDRVVSGATERTHHSYVTHDESTAVPDQNSVISLDLEFDFHPVSLRSQAVQVSHARTVVSLGLCGVSKEDFACVAKGDTMIEQWYVFPTSQLHPTQVDLQLDEWGGMALCEPLVLASDTRALTALSGEWQLTFNACENSWDVTDMRRTSA
jgi:hypothetical protein